MAAGITRRLLLLATAALALGNAYGYAHFSIKISDAKVSDGFMATSDRKKVVAIVAVRVMDWH
jgi:hypothetical protein